MRLLQVKLKGKQYKQNTSPKTYKTEIKTLANPGLASSGFEQPGPEFVSSIIQDIMILFSHLKALKLVI